jgi:phenylacetic acid degradation protein paaN
MLNAVFPTSDTDIEPGNSSDPFDRHFGLLQDALKAIQVRGHWSPFPDVPTDKAYSASARKEGVSAASRYLGKRFELGQPDETVFAGCEQSPWGVPVDVAYPQSESAQLIAAARAAQTTWQRMGPKGRIGILLEGLIRIHQRSHEIAHAVMLTTGQGELMAFQAGGPHAQDRALEAIAYAWKAMADVPSSSEWRKPQIKSSLLKHFEVVGRGVALVIGCSTFPTWNAYPGLFAALATGNPVIVKPHPNAVLPMAISIEILRAVFAENGLDPNIVTLAAYADVEATQELATHPYVASIDFTGGNAFGQWLKQHTRNARLYAEMSGINSTIVESTDDYTGMIRNLTFTLSLYSGRMCTTTRNIYIPREGIATDQGHKSFDQIGQDLAESVTRLLAFPSIAADILGAIGSEDLLAHLDDKHKAGKIVLDARKIVHPKYPAAQLRTPLIVALDSRDAESIEQERFGPISMLIATDSKTTAMREMESLLHKHGALTLGAYSTDTAFVDELVALSHRVKVALSINLTSDALINQSSSFSDYHATGGNPAANASYVNLAFVADRFVIVQRREQLKPEQAIGMRAM